jgi:hypothetical protein
MYLAEVVPAAQKGRVMGTFPIGLVGGIFISFLVIFFVPCQDKITGTVLFLNCDTQNDHMKKNFFLKMFILNTIFVTTFGKQTKSHFRDIANVTNLLIVSGSGLNLTSKSLLKFIVSSGKCI